MDMKMFVKERNEALLTMDEKKLRNYIKKYSVHMPAKKIVFWAAIHKARLTVKEIPEAEKEISRQWLRENGFRAEYIPV